MKQTALYAWHIRFAAAILLVVSLPGVAATNSMINLVHSEFIFETAPFPQCHASTIVDVNGQLLAAWFGGARESAKDVQIWLSRRQDGKWTAPVAVATGILGERQYPTWNPVLFKPKDQLLTLFYKVGPSPDTWWGMKMQSQDAGETWSKGERLPEGVLGPIKDKPVQLPNGDIIAPSSTEHDGWRVHFERSSDGGRTWTSGRPVGDPEKFGAIQPTILFHPNGQLQALCRSRKGKIVQTWSRDEGRTWSDLQPTLMPNPNSGIDATTLRTGGHVLVYNPTTKGRTPLNVAFSADGGIWTDAVTLEKDPGEYSYPAVIQAADGRVHVTYTWKRTRIKHAVLEFPPGK